MSLAHISPTCLPCMCRRARNFPFRHVSGQASPSLDMFQTKQASPRWASIALFQLHLTHGLHKTCAKNVQEKKSFSHFLSKIRQNTANFLQNSGKIFKKNANLTQSYPWVQGAKRKSIATHEVEKKQKKSRRT